MRLQSFTPQSFQSIPLGPGIVVANMVDVDNITPAKFLAAVRGDEAAGQRLGVMNASPSFSSESEVTDLMESIVGVSGAYKGSKQVQTIAATMTISLSELTPSNLHLLHPGLRQTDWTDDNDAVIGSKFVPKGYFDDDDYTDNLVYGMETSNSDILSIIVAKNVLNTEAFEISLEDDGSVGGIEATLTAHAGPEDFDAERGNLIPGYAFFLLDTSPVAPEPVV